ncbi:retrovirus-related pol polyprotein from transposon TNT 1-94 [Tanacetum coccineum]
MGRGEERCVEKRGEKKKYGMEGHSGNKGSSLMDRGQKGSRRIIREEEHEINSHIMGRSVVGEVKALCFLEKLPVLCEEQGLGVIKVRLLGGLEVMVVLENEATVENVLMDKEHGLRRWLYKLRKGESVHGTVLGLTNCTLKGNQNLVYERVQIHTSNKGLINEEVIVIVKGINHKVNAVEEVRDISSIDIHVVDKRDHEYEKVKDQVDEEMKIDRDEEEFDSEEGGSRGRGRRRIKFLGETRVSNAFDGEVVSSKDEEHRETERAHGEDNRRVYGVGNEKSNDDVKDTCGEEMIGAQNVNNESETKKRVGILSGPSYNGNGLHEKTNADMDNGLDKLVDENNKATEVNKSSSDSISCGDNTSGRRDKRAISSPNSVDSGYTRLMKKRKNDEGGLLEGNEEKRVFNQGKSSNKNGEGKKKVGRRSIMKAKNQNGEADGSRFVGFYSVLNSDGKDGNAHVHTSRWVRLMKSLRLDQVAYRLTLPQELSSAYDTFYVSNIKKCLAEPTLHVHLEEIQVDAKLSFVEKPVKILEREIKKLKRSRIPIVMCKTRSSTKELFSPFENPKQNFHSRRRLFDTPSLVELNSPEFDHIFDIEEQSEEEVREIMTETMEQHMSKTRENYGSGVTRPTINQDTPFELKGQFIKELRDNTFSGSEHEDANEHIEKVLEIVDLFHILKVTQDQIMLRAFLVSLTGAASRWLRNQPSGSITTWEVLKTKFLNKYCPPARTAKKMEEINNFQQEADESLFRALERFKELLMKCPQHYLTDMQEVILFYNGLDVPTRQILDSKGAIPSKTAADAKIAIQEMAEYS